MIRDPAGESALDLAVKRLERAMAMVEHRLAQAPASAASPRDDGERARLAAELDRARARERDLERAGAEASEALGRAIAEINTALNGGSHAQAGEA